MPLINSLRVDVFGPPVALSHSGQQIEEKSASVQRERESDHETAIHPSVVSNLAHTPSLDHVPGHPVRAVARPLTKLVCAGLSVHLHRAVSPSVRFEQFPNTLWIMVLDSGGSPRTINRCEVIY